MVSGCWNDKVWASTICFFLFLVIVLNDWPPSALKLWADPSLKLFELTSKFKRNIVSVCSVVSFLFISFLCCVSVILRLVNVIKLIWRKSRLSNIKKLKSLSCAVWPVENRPKMISLEKWMILTLLQKLPNNVDNWDKIIVATGFE